MTPDIRAALSELREALEIADVWHASDEGDLYRVTVTRELRGGQACGCDPKNLWPCERGDCRTANAIHALKELRR